MVLLGFSFPQVLLLAGGEQLLLFLFGSDGGGEITKGERHHHGPQSLTGAQWEQDPSSVPLIAADLLQHLVEVVPAVKCCGSGLKCLMGGTKNIRSRRSVRQHVVDAHSLLGLNIYFCNFIFLEWENLVDKQYL